MLSNSDIIKRAYILTIRHPVLWVFGLFVIGGFNLNFLHFANVPAVQTGSGGTIGGAFLFFQENPDRLALLSLGLLAFSLAGIVITNLSKVLLIQGARTASDNRPVELGALWKNGTVHLWRVVKISLLTTSVMVAMVAILFIPPLLWVESVRYQIPLFVVAAVLLLPLTFATSCFNIFTTFFVVLFSQPFKTAFAQAADLFVTCWPRVLGLFVILVLIYFSVFAAGSAFIVFARSLSGYVYTGLSHGLGFEGFSVIMITVTRLISGLFLWILVAGLNVFFNIAILLLFLELIQPLEKKEKAVVPKALPASTI